MYTIKARFSAFQSNRAWRTGVLWQAWKQIKAELIKGSAVRELRQRSSQEESRSWIWFVLPKCVFTSTSMFLLSRIIFSITGRQLILLSCSWLMCPSLEHQLCYESLWVRSRKYKAQTRNCKSKEPKGPRFATWVAGLGFSQWVLS